MSVRDAATGKEVIRYDSVSGLNSGAAFTADGTRLRTLGSDGVVKDWPVPPRAPDPFKLPFFVAADPSGRRMVVLRRLDERTSGFGSGWPTRVELLRSEGGPPTVLDGAVAYQRAITAAFSPDGRSVATAFGGITPPGGDRQANALQVWDESTGKTRWSQTLTTDPFAVQYTPDGKWVGVLGRQLTNRNSGFHVLLFDAVTGAPGPAYSATAQGFRAGFGQWKVYPLPFGADGRWVADVTRAAEQDGTDVIAVRDLTSGHAQRRFVGPAGTRAVVVVFSPDGRRVAAGFAAAEPPSKAENLPAPPAGMFVLRIEDSGPGKVVVWDVTSGQELWSAGSPRGGAQHLAFSPDGNRLAVTYWRLRSAEAVVYDVERGAERFQLRNEVSERFALTFSPDSRRIATVNAETLGVGEVKLWDTDTGRELLTLPSGAHAEAIGFTADGTRLSAWGSTLGGGLPAVLDATPRPETKKP